jgi:hypothetical protein
MECDWPLQTLDVVTLMECNWPLQTLDDVTLAVTVPIVAGALSS